MNSSTPRDFPSRFTWQRLLSGHSVYCCLLLVLAFSFVVGLLLLLARNERIAQARQSMLTLARIMTLSISRESNQIDQALRAVQADPKLAHHGFAPGTIVLLNPQGAVMGELRSSPDRSLGAGLSAGLGGGHGAAHGAAQPLPPFIRFHQQSDPSLHVSTTGTNTGLVLSRRVSTPDGAFQGVVAGRLDLAHLAGMLRGRGAIGQTTILIDLYGTPLVWPAQTRRAWIDPAGLPPLLDHAPEESRTGRRRIDGQDVIFATARWPDSSTRVLMAVPTSLVLAGWRRRVTIVLLITALLCTALVILFELFRQELNRRLRAEERALQAGKELQRNNESLERHVRAEIAAHEATQAQLCHHQKMEALGQLASGIAHDVNNVLHSIGATAELLEHHARDNPAVIRLAAQIQSASTRGGTITARLLSFARKDALRADIIATAPFLAELRDMLAHTLGARIRVTLQADGDLPPVRADRSQLETVLVNLAINARDAMPDGGVLTLVAEPWRNKPMPRNRSPGDFLRVSVSDTGLGMAPATLARASEPFFTTKADGRGTGLGLSMAQGFAEQSGGMLDLWSAPGQGTTVCLYLPLATLERPRSSLAFSGRAIQAETESSPNDRPSAATGREDQRRMANSAKHE